MQYRVITASQLLSLELGVMQLLKEGWQLSGGVCVCIEPYTLFAQAMFFVPASA